MQARLKSSCMRPVLEGADAFFGDELVDADVHGLAEAAEAFTELFGPVGLVGAAEEVVPDVLRLPEVDLEGELAKGSGEDEDVGEGGGGGVLVGDGGFELDHGALHALSAGVAKLLGVEVDVLGGGPQDERGDEFWI